MKRNNNWKCNVCNCLIADKRDTCGENVMVDNGSALAKPVRYGDEVQTLTDDRCPHCLVKKGGVHHPYCEIEQCPFCAGKIMLCGCVVRQAVIR